MKNVLYFSLLFTISSIVYPQDQFNMSCKMPSEQELQEIICKNGREHFCEKTQLPKALAERKRLHPLGVVNSVELALFDYEADLSKPNVTMAHQVVIQYMHRTKYE